MVSLDKASELWEQYQQALQVSALLEFFGVLLNAEPDLQPLNASCCGSKIYLASNSGAEDMGKTGEPP